MNIAYNKYCNRTSKPFDTDAYLLTGGCIAKSHIICGAKAVAECRFEIECNTVPENNRAMLNICGIVSCEIAFRVPMKSGVEQLEIADGITVEYAKWRDMAYFAHHGCTVINPDAFLRGVPDRVDIDGLEFKLNGRFAPIATRTHRVLDIPIGKNARKLFVLFSAFADDHEICSELFDAEIECEKGDAYMPPLYKKTLYFPGDLDYGFGAEVDADFSTYKTGAVRPSILPELGEDDYLGIIPPDYPARDIWCKNKAVEVGNTVFNLLEFDLGETRDIKRLTLVAKASDAAGGVFGIAFC